MMNTPVRKASVALTGARSGMIATRTVKWIRKSEYVWSDSQRATRIGARQRTTVLSKSAYSRMKAPTPSMKMATPLPSRNAESTNATA